MFQSSSPFESVLRFAIAFYDTTIINLGKVSG